MNACVTAIDDELAVLGWFIIDPDCRRRLVSEIRSEESFEPSGLAPLWNLLRAMHAAGSEINPATVRREAKKAKLSILDEQHAQLARRSSNLDESVRAVRLAAMRRWMHRQGETITRAAIDPDINPIELASRFYDEFGKAIRVASKISDRSGGSSEVRDRIRKMADGSIQNIAWPDAPVFTKQARALESGSITMLSGSPGDGKTFWLLQSLIDWYEAGVRVSVLMMEKTRDWHLARILALLSGRPEITQTEWVRRHHEEAKAIDAQYESHTEALGKCIMTARQVGDSLDDIARWIDTEADEHDIVVVDPISLADAGEKRWIADRNFINTCIRTCERTGARIVLVTHPNATKGGPVGLSSLMGGTTYQRATDCVMHVKKLDKPKPYRVMTRHQIEETVTCNREVHIFKGRNGVAGGKCFAFNFDAKTLRFTEQGLITAPADGSDTHSSEEAA